VARESTDSGSSLGEEMRSPLRHLFNPVPRRRRGGARPDPYFADPAVVEDDYIRFRRVG
jgi:hypothetical protein